jgi:hypothetical protein
MKTEAVNFYILGEVLSLLERIQLIDGIAFEQFDPDDQNDVQEIAQRFVRPAIEGTSEVKKRQIRATLEYFSGVGEAPIQLLKDRCQELSLADAEDWKQFFGTMGKALFPDFMPADSGNRFEEQNDEASSEMVFANV